MYHLPLCWMSSVVCCFSCTALRPSTASTSSKVTYQPATDMDIHTIHLHRQSDDMLLAYDEVKHLDTVAGAMSGQSQLTRGFHCPSWFEGKQWADYRDFQRRHEIENVIVTADTVADTGATQWLSLFRSDPDAQCRPEELQMVARLAPHLMQALRHNRARHLAGLPGANPLHQAAIADARGVLHYATPGCVDLLREEWGGTPANRLPVELLDWVCTQRGPYRGRHVVATHHMAMDLLFVRIRPSCPPMA